jgi:uncharacterized DUF497 family protein
MLNFTWDEQKETANRQKHGVSFDEARTVFFDEHARLIADPDSSDDEERFIILGYSERLRLLVVCHCYRENDSIIRIISARKATRPETKTYGRFRK